MSENTVSKIFLPAVYAIANVDDMDQPIDYVQRLLNAGVSLLQIRSKNMNDKDLTALSTEIVKLARSHDKEKTCSVKIIINDRYDIAHKVQADGVHMGQEDSPIREARELLGLQSIIGFSTHTREQFVHGLSLPISYIAFGPVFLSPTKQGHAETTGIENLSEVAKLTNLPLVAIGGINSENASQVFEAGADSIAMISELRGTKDPAALIADFELKRKRI